MALLWAEFWDDQSRTEARRTRRKRLRLELPSSPELLGAIVLIHDLSETGIMIQTSAKLAVGDRFEVELPRAGSTTAQVIWTRETTYGCEFIAPISKAAVSAALLLSPHNLPGQSADAKIAAHEDLGSRDAATPVNQTAVMMSLALLAVLIVLFIVALLTAPFSI